MNTYLLTIVIYICMFFCI